MNEDEDKKSVMFSVSSEFFTDIDESFKSSVDNMNEIQLQAEFEKVMQRSWYIGDRIRIMCAQKEELQRQHILRLYLGIFSCRDLFNLILDFITVTQDGIHIILVSKQWHMQFIQKLEAIEAHLLPRDSWTERRQHYKSVLSWVRELYRHPHQPTQKVLQSELKAKLSLVHGASVDWHNLLGHSYPAISAEWLNIALQKETEIPRSVLLHRCVRHNQDTRYATILLRRGKKDDTPGTFWKADIDSALQVALDRSTNRLPFISLLLEYGAQFATEQVRVICKSEDLPVFYKMIDSGMNPFVHDCFHEEGLSRKLRVIVRQNFLRLADRFKLNYKLQLTNFGKLPTIHFVYEIHGVPRYVAIPASLGRLDDEYF